MRSLCILTRALLDLRQDLAAGCVKANISSGTQAVAQELMREEVAHITALNNQLRSIGESPSCPLINLGMLPSPVPFACITPFYVLKGFEQKGHHVKGHI